MSKFDFSALHTSGMKVVFIKKDGTERTMICTTNLNRVPADRHPNGNGRPAAPGLHKVFDLEKGEWRSFRDESVISAEPLPAE